jgi:hypothetical protein
VAEMTDEARVVALDRVRLWLAATLADELSITSGPDSTIVSLYVQLEQPRFCRQL